MFVVGIVGRSRSGKTDLIKRLIPELKKRRFSVAAVKHCPHGFSLDLEGKDSWEFMAAGADGVGLAGRDQLAVIRKGEPGRDLPGLAARWFPDADIVLVEAGPGVSGMKTIEVLRRGDRRPTAPPGGLLAVVSERKPSVKVPCFRRDDVEKIANFLEAIMSQEKPNIRVEVDGNELPLNPFVRTVFANVVLGLVRSLKGVGDRPRSVVICLTPGRQKGRRP